MKEGDIVLAPLPQADGWLKNRPAVVLREMPPFGDLLVCGVSAQLQRQVAGFDEVIRPSDSDFAGSGLKAACLIRLGAIGSISQERHKQLLRRLCQHLSPD